MIGIVLWWSDKSKNGVVVDSSSNEYYFDVSVLTKKQIAKVEKGAVLKFSYERINGLLCITSVNIPSLKQKKRLEVEYEASKNQLSLPFVM